ncbi:hypothetical protein SHKM778_10340 [Streptomyces sp. KM77-8]|uniref:Uncharacterized protein n=1 Tax=Streptomyces haneummycinicus TaxID=3074435 RepID=A0AAT9HB83_9ACTN
MATGIESVAPQPGPAVLGATLAADGGAPSLWNDDGSAAPPSSRWCSAWPPTRY